MMNISNHSSTKWSKEQLEAAGSEVIDIQFPNVNPQVTTEELDDLAERVVREVESYTSATMKYDGWKDKYVFHVMGEMTLSYLIVRMLQVSGFKVVASTTERKVVEQPDGTKMSVFSFVQFREYPTYEQDCSFGTLTVCQMNAILHRRGKLQKASGEFKGGGKG